MIIKSTENILIYQFGVNPNPNEANKTNADVGREQITFDEKAASILQSIFKLSDNENYDTGNLENFPKTASLKFMITLKDEKDLRTLGYSQVQIDKIKPQEAMDILQAATKP